MIRKITFLLIGGLFSAPMAFSASRWTRPSVASAAKKFASNFLVGSKSTGAAARFLRPRRGMQLVPQAFDWNSGSFRRFSTSSPQGGSSLTASLNRRSPREDFTCKKSHEGKVYTVKFGKYGTRFDFNKPLDLKQILKRLTPEYPLKKRISKITVKRNHWGGTRAELQIGDYQVAQDTQNGNPDSSAVFYNRNDEGGYWDTEHNQWLLFLNGSFLELSVYLAD